MRVATRSLRVASAATVQLQRRSPAIAPRYGLQLRPAAVLSLPSGRGTGLPQSLARGFSSNDDAGDVLRERSSTIRELADATGGVPPEYLAGLPADDGNSEQASEVTEGATGGSDFGGDLETFTELSDIAATASSPGYSWSLSTIPQLVADGLGYLNHTWDVPYATSVITLTVCIRLALAPLSFKMQRNSAKLQIVQPQLNAAMEKVKKARARKDQLAAKAATEEAQLIMAKSGANPVKNLLFILPQMAIFLPTFFGLRKLADLDPSLAAESFLWIPSLASPDPMFIMPALFGMTMIGAFELGADGVQAAGKMRYLMWGMGVFVPVATYNFPSIIHMFWVTGTFMAAGQSQLLKRSPALKKFFGIPEVPKNVVAANKAAGIATNPLAKVLEKMPLPESSPMKKKTKKIPGADQQLHGTTVKKGKRKSKTK